MSGCYGGSVEDRYYEQQLMNFLDSDEYAICESCGDYEEEFGCVNCKDGTYEGNS